MTEDFSKNQETENHTHKHGGCKGRMNGKQKAIVILASVSILTFGSIVNTVLDNSTAIEKASIEADASIQRADILSNKHETKNINLNFKGQHHHPRREVVPPINPFNELNPDGEGLQRQFRDLLGPDAPEIIIQKYQRIYDDGSALNADHDGVIDPGHFNDGSSLVAPPPGFHDDSVIQPSSFHKGKHGKKSGISAISDNDESVGDDGVDPNASSANPLDQLKGLSSAQKAQALNSVAGAVSAGEVPLSQLSQYCPQIVKALAGKSQDQIDAYEMAVGAQLAPGNEAQAKTILDNVIKSCNEGGDKNSGNSTSDSSGS